MQCLGPLGLFLLITFFPWYVSLFPVSLHPQQFLVENWTLYCSYSGLYVVFMKIIFFLFCHIVTLLGLKFLKIWLFRLYNILFCSVSSCCFLNLALWLFSLCLHILVFSKKFAQICAKILRLTLRMVPLLCGSPQSFSCSFSSKLFPLTS